MGNVITDNQLQMLIICILILAAITVVCVSYIIVSLVVNRDTSRNECSSNVATSTPEPEKTSVGTGEMREITLDIVEQRERNAIQYIENPLPVPKRREHKEMDYAIEVSEDSDFDLHDLTGLDYFDLE